MRMNLDELEIRVLGSLMEKELATPENYPLSLNALLSACNQKSNRDPVLNLSEADLAGALERLSGRGLARLTTIGGRVARYRHSVAEKLGLAPAARAVLAELMLRGPQTASELRGRAGRMVDLGDVDALLNELKQAGPPLVLLLPRQPGRKEQRYAQLFAGMPELPEEEAGAPEGMESSQVSRPPAAGERLLRLEGEIGTLREDVAALRREVEELIDSFR
jgi:uncharacterized protein